MNTFLIITIINTIIFTAILYVAGAERVTKFIEFLDKLGSVASNVLKR